MDLVDLPKRPEGKKLELKRELDSVALDFRAASESFAAVRKLRKADLATPRLVTTHQGREVPTVGGILL